MPGGLKRVQSMCQYTHGLVTIVQGLTVGTDVHAVSQSADDEHLRADAMQVVGKAADDVYAILGAEPGAYDIDDLLLIQVGCAAIVQYQRRIIALPEPRRIRLIVHAQRLNAMLEVILQLCFRPFHRFFGVVHRLDETRGTVGTDVSKLIAMLEDGRRAAQRTVKL